MTIILVEDYKELSYRAAQLLASQIIEKKNSVLGLTTDSTPIGMYKELVRKFQKGELDFSEVVTFNLDEYYGLSPKHPQSYHFFMWNTFFKYINIKKENVYLLNGVTEDIDKECKQYEYLIRKNGGIDLQILGIGDNGMVKNLTSIEHIVIIPMNNIIIPRINTTYFSLTSFKRKSLIMFCKTIKK